MRRKESMSSSQWCCCCCLWACSLESKVVVLLWVVLILLVLTVGMILDSGRLTISMLGDRHQSKYDLHLYSTIEWLWTSTNDYSLAIGLLCLCYFVPLAKCLDLLSVAISYPYVLLGNYLYSANRRHHRVGSSPLIHELLCMRKCGVFHLILLSMIEIISKFSLITMFLFLLSVLIFGDLSVTLSDVLSLALDDSSHSHGSKDYNSYFLMDESSLIVFRSDVNLGLGLSLFLFSLLGLILLSLFIKLFYMNHWFCFGLSLDRFFRWTEQMRFSRAKRIANHDFNSRFDLDSDTEERGSEDDSRPRHNDVVGEDSYYDSRDSAGHSSSQSEKQRIKRSIHTDEREHHERRKKRSGGKHYFETISSSRSHSPKPNKPHRHSIVYDEQTDDATNHSRRIGDAKASSKIHMAPMMTDHQSSVHSRDHSSRAPVFCSDEEDDDDDGSEDGGKKKEEDGEYNDEQYHSSDLELSVGNLPLHSQNDDLNDNAQSAVFSLGESTTDKHDEIDVGHSTKTSQSRLKAWNASSVVSSAAGAAGYPTANVNTALGLSRNPHYGSLDVNDSMEPSEDCSQTMTVSHNYDDGGNNHRNRDEKSKQDRDDDGHGHTEQPGGRFKNGPAFHVVSPDMTERRHIIESEKKKRRRQKRKVSRGMMVRRKMDPSDGLFDGQAYYEDTMTKADDLLLRTALGEEERTSFVRIHLCLLILCSVALYILCTLDFFSFEITLDAAHESRNEDDHSNHTLMNKSTDIRNGSFNMLNLVDYLIKHNSNDPKWIMSLVLGLYIVTVLVCPILTLALNAIFMFLVAHYSKLPRWTRICCDSSSTKSTRWAHARARRVSESDNGTEGCRSCMVQCWLRIVHKHYLILILVRLRGLIWLIHLLNCVDVLIVSLYVYHYEAPIIYRFCADRELSNLQNSHESNSWLSLLFGLINDDDSYGWQLSSNLKIEIKDAIWIMVTYVVLSWMSMIQIIYFVERTFKLSDKINQRSDHRIFRNDRDTRTVDSSQADSVGKGRIQYVSDWDLL